MQEIQKIQISKVRDWLFKVEVRSYDPRRPNLVDPRCGSDVLRRCCYNVG